MRLWNMRNRLKLSVEYGKQVEIAEYEKQNEKVNEEEEEGAVPFVACEVTEELEYVN